MDGETATDRDRRPEPEPGATTSPSPPLRLRELVDGLLAEQRSRWDRGDRVGAEEFLDRHPELNNEPELVLDLVAHEYLLGRDHGGGPGLSELIARFPGQQAALVRQIAVTDALLSAYLSKGPAAETEDGERIPGRLGRFELIREIGRGRFGVVYAARDDLLNRDVAIKVARPELAADPEFVVRFRRESSAAAKLEHPGIVRVHEAGQEGETHYFVMELCRGRDLSDWLAESGPIAPREAAALVRQIAQAVAAAHAAGVVHRDLKPANIMLTPVDGSSDSRVKVLDFGLASVQDELSDTRSSVIMGTPLYMAPEQAERGKSDERSDVFAIGAILYELLTSRPPFAADNVAGVFEKLRTAEATPPTRLVEGVDPRLDTICLRCLRRFPDDRYQSAAAVEEDLRRYLEDEPLAGRRVRFLDRLSSWSRQPERLRDCGAFVVIATILTFTWTWAAYAAAASMPEANDAWTTADLSQLRLFAAFLSIPATVVVLAGWRSIQRRVTAFELWVGLSFEGILALESLGVQSRFLVPPAPWYSENQLAMQMVHSGISLVMVAQCLAFVVLIRAQKARRVAMGRAGSAAKQWPRA